MKFQNTKSKNVDWELVEQFREGLEDLKKGNITEFEKSSLMLD